MRLLQRRMSASDKDAALRLIRHLQTMYAYQQLTMERYNDALARAGLAPLGNEISHSATSGLITPKSVYDLVIPALVAKRETFEHLHEEHATFGRPTVVKQQSAYDDFGRLLAKMRERTEAQYNGYLAWVGDATSAGVDTSALDLAELRALDVSISSLNALIEQTRLDPEGFLDINHDAHNTVRASIGLHPLSGVEFRSRYFNGLASGSGRFFND
jgi:hypothetical protein